MYTHCPAPDHELYKSTSCWCPPPPPTLAAAKSLFSGDAHRYLLKRFMLRSELQKIRQRRGWFGLKTQQSTRGRLWATQIQTTYRPGWRSGKDEEGEGEGEVVLLPFILLRCNHSNRSGGEDGCCRCTNSCFANKMVMDAMVRVGDGGGPCLATKATLAVTDCRSGSNSTINPWARRYERATYPPSAWVRLRMRRKRRRRYHPSPLHH